MVRDTSIDAYYSIKHSGKVSKLQKYFYTLLFDNGPCTARHLFDIGVTRGKNTASPNLNIHARIFELKKMGLVKEVGAVICPKTLKKVTLYDVTCNPVPLEKPKELTKKQKKEQILTLLEDICTLSRYELLKRKKELEEKILKL